jgi:FlaA1/EpsC-like NDP-sugar epimerase
MRRSLLTLTWLITDALIFTGAYSLAYFIKVGWIFSSDLPYQTFLSAVGITVPGWLFVMLTMRNFALSREQKSIRNFIYIAYACGIGMAGFTLAFYFLKAAVFSRLLLLIAGIFSTILVFIWHIIFDHIQRVSLRSGNPTYPMLIIGTNREAERLIQKLQKRLSPFTPVAVLSGKGGNSNEIAGVPVLGKLNKLEEVLKEKHITHLVQCDQLEHSINLLSVCREHQITYFLLPFVLGVIEDHVPTEALEGQQVVAVEHGAKWHWFFR